MDDASVQTLLREGIAAAKLAQQNPAPAAGNPREQAQELLLRVIELDQENVSAWLWLSTVVSTSEERRICLENVLLLDPQNKHALAGLARLKPRAPAAEPAPAPPSPQPARSKYTRLKPQATPPPSSPKRSAPAQQKSPVQGRHAGLACPFCGNAISAVDKRCEHCQLPLVMVCPACKAAVDVEQKSCPDCGQKMGNYQKPLPYFAQLGVAYQAGTLYPEALTAWQAVETLQPDYSHLQLRLGEVQLGLGRPDRAWASLQQALEQEPESAAVYFALGELARQRGERHEAFEHYQVAAQLDPQHGQAWFRLGQIYQQARKPQEATQAFRRAAKLMPAETTELAQIQAQLEHLNPGLPESMATSGAELFRQMAGPMSLFILAALMDAGLRPWWIPVTGWLALFLAFIGAFLYVSGTDLPRNPLMQALAGERGLTSDEAKLGLALGGAALWLLAMLLILLPIGQSYPELPGL